MLFQVSKTMKHARKGTCIITNPFYFMFYTIFQNQRMMCTDYIKREHDNDMYVHLLEKKNQNITDIRGSSCGYEFFITDPY